LFNIQNKVSIKLSDYTQTHKNFFKIQISIFATFALLGFGTKNK